MCEPQSVTVCTQLVEDAAAPYYAVVTTQCPTVPSNVPAAQTRLLAPGVTTFTLNGGAALTVFQREPRTLLVRAASALVPVQPGQGLVLTQGADPSALLLTASAACVPML